MKFNVGTDNLTGRARLVALESDNFSEEKFLTLLETLLKKGRGRITVSTGKVKLTWKPLKKLS